MKFLKSGIVEYFEILKRLNQFCADTLFKKISLTHHQISVGVRTEFNYYSIMNPHWEWYHIQKYLYIINLMNSEFRFQTIDSLATLIESQFIFKLWSISNPHWYPAQFFSAIDKLYKPIDIWFRFQQSIHHQK